MAAVPEIIISPSGMVSPLLKHPFFHRGSSQKLFRQDACDEDLGCADNEDSCNEVDSGIGSATSSFSRTFSDCRDDDYSVRDSSDGLNDSWGTGSSRKISLEAAKRAQHFRESSGYGTGDSCDLPDSLENSAASSVFAEANSTPTWMADCDRLIRELTTEIYLDHLEGMKSFPEETHHLLFWQNEEEFVSASENADHHHSCEHHEDSICTNDLQISDTSTEEGFVSASGNADHHHSCEHHEDSICTNDLHISDTSTEDCLDSYLGNTAHHSSELSIKVDVANPSQLHSASMCHFLMGKRISEVQCPSKEADCNEARGLLNWLHKCYHLGHLQHCLLCERTLGNIMEHNKECSEFLCPLPFCHVMKERQQSLKRQLSMEEMKGEVSLVGKLSAMESLLSSMQRLSSWVWNGCQPGTAEAIPLAFLGRFGKFNVLLARTRDTTGDPSKYSSIVVKKVLKRDNLLPALKIVRSLTCTKLLSLLDVVEDCSHLVLISAFTSGVTFKELLLQEDKYGRWEWLNHFCQVVSALSFLHQYNVLFLNWELDNILIKSDGKQACLLISQGSLTLIPEGVSSIPVDDILQEMLSPYISPPEILQKEEVGFSADVWGCGVLMYQLITKKVPHGSLRHLSWSKARDIIQTNRQTPRVPDECPEHCRAFLHQCFAWSPCDRPSVKTLLHKSSKPIYAVGSDSFEKDYLSSVAEEMNCLE